MYGRNIAMTVMAVCGLLMMAGTGCSDDKNGDVEKAMLQAQLSAKQREMDCKVAVLSQVCATGDTACNTNKTSALAACSLLSGTSTATATSTSASTSTVTTN